MSTASDQWRIWLGFIGLKDEFDVNLISLTDGGVSVRLWRDYPAIEVATWGPPDARGWTELHRLESAVRNSPVAKGAAAEIAEKLAAVEAERDKLRQEVEDLKRYRAHYRLQFKAVHGKECPP